MSQDFQQVNYKQFRNTLELSGGKKVKSNGLMTFIYDRKNRMFAVLKAASIDTLGRASDAEYFIRYA